MKYILLLLTIFTSVAFAQIDMTVGTFNVRGNDYTYRLSVYPDGFVVLENYDKFRYGVIADGGSTITFTFLPSDEPTLMEFQQDATATYNVTMRDVIFLEFENDVSGSFLVMRTKDEPADPFPAEVRSQLATAAQQAVNTEKVEGVSVTIDDFVGRWRRDRDDMDLVLEFLPSGGYRSTLNGAVFYGTVSVSGTEITLNGFGAANVSVIPISGVGYKRNSFYATEDGEDIIYRKEGELTLTDEDVEVARTLIAAQANSSQQPNNNNNQTDNSFAESIVGQWQTVYNDAFITTEFRADHTYHFYVSSLTEGNYDFGGTYSVSGNVLTQKYPDGSQVVSTLESLMVGSFMKFVESDSFWFPVPEGGMMSATVNPSGNAATNLNMSNTVPANNLPVNNTTATANDSADIMSLTMQHQMEMQQIQMINDAINQSSQMTQGIAWDIGGTSWGWDYGY